MQYMYMYIPKLETVRSGAGKNESNFEKNIHLRKRLFFYYWIFKCTLFLVVCVPVFPLFSFATHLTISPTPATNRAINIFECRVTSFIFIQILVAAALKHAAAACLPNVGLRGRTPYIFESVFFAVVVVFFCFVRFVRITIHTHIT